MVSRVPFSNKRDQELYDAMRNVSPERQRSAALVALCEEVLTEHASTLSIAHELFGPLGPMLDEVAAKLPDYRARLATLKGEAR